MYRLARIHRHEVHTDADRVAYADQVTSMNDARAALCLAMGIDIDDIHPVTGHHMRTEVRT